MLFACSTTKKVPEGRFLLTKNNFEYKDQKLFTSRIPNFVSQKPNTKAFFIAPIPLWAYNFSNPKYDSILAEYMTFPRQMRNQRLRDSLFIKYEQPESVGKKLFWDRFFHTVGQPPVILDETRTENSANSIREFMVYKGYWDAKVDFRHDLDSAAKKAKATYSMTFNDPTFVKEYFYKIPYDDIRTIYEGSSKDSHIKAGDILDQENLEKEVSRVTDIMRKRGYYTFNRTNEEIFFTADTLKSRKDVPLTMEIQKDTIGGKYKLTTIGNIDLYVIENPKDIKDTEKDSLDGIRFHQLDNQFKKRSLWRPIIIAPGEIYDQKNLDLTKRNLIALNNFSIIKARDSIRKGATTAPNDSILDVVYYLKPLEKYNFKISTDAHYSQTFNFGFTPSVELTQRNLFGGLENISTSIGGTFGTTSIGKNAGKLFNAYELSIQNTLNFPRLLLPFRLSNLIPKRYSPSSNINIGASFQQNIGMGRTNFNAGLNYFINVNDVVSHRFSVLNAQLSLTRQKDNFFEIFDKYKDYRDELFTSYPNTQLIDNYYEGNVKFDEITNTILNDNAYINSLNAEQRENLLNFQRALQIRDIQTQDVIVSSFTYNFLYNEIGKKEYRHPFYINAKGEFAGNLLGLFSEKDVNTSLTENQPKTLFKIPYSQFFKLDLDIRKQFKVFGTEEKKHVFAIRQFIGLGIPYGNSSRLPFIRSYINGGSNDIRAWRAFDGLGPGSSKVDKKIRDFTMGDIKLTTNLEYRIPFTDMYEGAIFTDVGNIWTLKDNKFGGQFKFNKFLSELGVGSGFGLRVKVAYLIARIDLAYKVYDPNETGDERWRIKKFQPLKPTLNFGLNYPF